MRYVICGEYERAELSIEGVEMDKCEGCPLRMVNTTRRVFRCPLASVWVDVQEQEVHKRCHLTTADFPRLRAELAGEWTCETCANRYGCRVKDRVPCTKWQPGDK